MNLYHLLVLKNNNSLLGFLEIINEILDIKRLGIVLVLSIYLITMSSYSEIPLRIERLRTYTFLCIIYRKITWNLVQNIYLGEWMTRNYIFLKYTILQTSQNQGNSLILLI